MLTDDPQGLLTADELLHPDAEQPVMSMTGTVMPNHLRLVRQASSQGSDSQADSQGPGADSQAAAVTVAVKPSEQEQKPWKQDGSKTAH